jgi:gliding motility-associated-like protein
VPTFGNGWDTSTLIAIPPASCSGDGGYWDWFDSVTSANTGDIYGPGFFYESPDGGQNPSDAGDNFGDHCPTAEAMTFCWEISTNDLSDCVPGMNLDIMVNTLSDDESGGSFLSPLCVDDPEAEYLAAIDCCDADAGDGQTIQLCQDDDPISLNDLLSTSSSGTWHFNDVSSPSLGSDFVFDPLLNPAGTYFFAVDGVIFPCTDYAAIEIILSSNPEAGTSNEITVCTNGGIIELISYLGADADAGGNWLDPNGAPWNGPYFGASDIPGTYTYYFGASGSCPSDSAQLAVNTIPQANAGENSTYNICPCDSPVSLTSILSGDPDTYGVWTDTNGQEMADDTYDPTSMPEGIYTYQIQAENCSDFSFLTINFLDLGEAGVGGVIEFCNSDDTDYDLFELLTGSPDAGGQWTGPNGPLSSGAFNPSTSPEGTYIYGFQCGSCSDLSSFNISIESTPNALLSGNAVLCSSIPVPLTLNLQGTGPFDVVIEDQNGEQIVLNNIDDGHVEMVQPTVSTTYTIVSANDQSTSCPSEIGSSVQITISPPPSATLSGNQEICPGQAAQLQVLISGNGPFLVEILDSSSGGTFFSPPVWSGDVINHFASENTTYSIVSITDSSMPTCSGVGNGEANVSIVSPPSLSITSAGGTLCAGEEGTAVVDISGSWTNYDLSLYTGFNTLEFTNVSDGDELSFDVPLSTPSSLPYCFTAINPTNSIGCASQLADTCFHFEVLQELLTTNVLIECDPFLSTGTVSFDVGGGSGPYTVDGVPLVGNSFTSPSLPDGALYSYEVQDSEGCGPITKSGEIACGCIYSTPGAFGTQNDTLTVCASSLLSASYNSSNEVIQSGDLRVFVLHDGGPNSLGNILSTSYVNPSFTFQSGLNANEVYYMCAVLGENNGMDLLDFDDPCLTFSEGIPVMFRPSPTVSLTSLAAICDGEEAEIQFDFDGNGPWNLELSLDGISYLDTVIENSTYVLNTGLEGNYVVETINDPFCPGLAGASVEVSSSSLPSAQISNGGTYCAGGSEGPEVDLTGTGPWNIVYNVNGMLDTLSSASNMAILPVSSSGSYELVTVSDANCTDQVNGSVIVESVEQPTASFSAAGPVCEGDSVEMLIQFTGPGPFEFLYDIDGSSSDTLTSNQNQFTVFSNVAGEVVLTYLDNGVCAGIGTNTEELIINPLPTVSLSVEDNQVCEGEVFDVTLMSTGVGPFNIQLTENGTPSVIEIPNTDDFIYGTFYFEDTELNILEVTDQSTGCRGESGESLIIDIVLYPPAMAGEDKEICGNDTVSIGFPSSETFNYTWSPEEGILNPNLPNSAYVIPNTSGEDVVINYTLSVDNQGCVSEDQVTITVESAPIAGFTINPFELTAVNPVANFFNLSNGQNFYLWTIDEDTVSTQSSFSYNFPEDVSAEYEVCLEATSTDAGCTSQICKDIEVTGAMSVYLPNSFTPNGDGLNDEFGPVTNNVDRLFFTFRVFDRWGQIIFETNNPNEWWDGTVRREDRTVRPGHYVYQILTRDVFHRQVREYTGEFHLIR